MSKWNQIETENDIAVLMDAFDGFHDSVIKSIRYESGNYVDENGGMVFAAPNEYELIIVFQGQWTHRTVELCFNGVRKAHLIGLEDRYVNDISDAYLAFHENLLPYNHRAPSKAIVWADHSGFDVNNASDNLQEPATTYIIASSLKWRVPDNNDL